jgi:outer membrane protein
VPLFQAGEVFARVAGAKSREKQAELALEEAKLIAREDVRRALADLQSAHIGLQLANEQLEAAQAEYDQAFELYRAQEATSLDLASSEASLADARRAVAEETLNRDLAELRVWHAAGAIKESVGVQPPATE